MFWAKRFLELFFRPLTLGLALAALGLVWPRVRRGRGKWLTAGALGLLLLFSCPFMSSLLLDPLKRHCAPFDVRAERPGTASRGGRWIAVLCGGYFSAERVSATSRLNPEFLQRFMEGVRIYRARPGSKLLVCLADPRDKAAPDRLLAGLAEIASVPREDLVPVVGGQTTRAETRLLRKLVGDEPLILVTSDYHMRRALLLCREAGLKPVPAPSGSCGLREDTAMRGLFYPAAQSLADADTAMHEYVGLLWAKLSGTWQ